jgi:hypothetical protein
MRFAQEVERADLGRYERIVELPRVELSKAEEAA